MDHGKGGIYDQTAWMAETYLLTPVKFLTSIRYVKNGDYY